MAKYIGDIIQDTAEAMSLGVLPLHGFGNAEIEERIDELGRDDYPALLWTIQQSGQYDIRGNRKAYKQYNAELLFVAPNLDGSTQAALEQLEGLSAVVAEFLQKLARREEWTNVIDNSGQISATFEEGALRGDAVAVYQFVTFPFKIDVKQVINC